MVLHALGAFAGTVAIREKLLWAQTGSEHRNYCGPGSMTEGCTRFVNDRANLVCSRNGGLWRIESSAELMAVIFLRRPGTIVDKREIVKHERAHISDVRGSLEAALSDVELERFAAEADCLAAAAGYREGFNQKLREAIQASKRIRDK